MNHPPGNYLEYAGRRFHYLWLRDNCRCEACLHPSGQRLHETWELDPRVAPRRVERGEQDLLIEWRDGHESRYSRRFLERHAYDRARPPADARVLWDGSLDPAAVSFAYPEVAADRQRRLEWLLAVRDYGFAFLADVPTAPGTIHRVVELFGFVRETNYGRLFEVVSEPKPANLAYTPRPLSLHTDNPYREPVPTLQLLHCLKAADEGGVTALADGFKAAGLLRESHPEAFDLLSSMPVEFRFRGDDVDLRHRATIIGLDPDGQVEAVRVNNRSTAPWDVPFERMEAFYRAYQRFMSILQMGGCKLTFRMREGELLLMDNERVLHGREMQAIGSRRLQGCYADRDGLMSTIRVLNGEHKDD